MYTRGSCAVKAVEHAIGALYPLAMEAVGRAWPARPAAACGAAAALNTCGNIVGVLLGGFYLLPQAGALLAIEALAAVCLALAAAVVALWPAAAVPRGRRWAALAGAGVLAVFALQPATFDYTALAAGSNVYFKRQSFGTVIAHAESVDGGLSAVAVSTSPDGERLRILLTNGKFQGNDGSHGEMQAQVGVALAPLLHTAARERALVIGFGTGVSARALHAAGFAALDGSISVPICCVWQQPISPASTLGCCSARASIPT